MARLKVFHATLGFFETVVAAPSKTAALQAWGAHQDLFATGAADLSADEEAQTAALARPGVVLRRAIGSTGPFEERADLGSLQLPKAKPASGKGKAAGAKSPPPPPDRTRLNAAEKALADRQARYEKDKSALEARRRALEAELDALRAAVEADRARLDAEREAAETAYRKAGG